MPPRGAPPLTIELSPLPLDLSVSTDLNGCRIQLDDEADAEVSPAVAFSRSLNPGLHRFKLSADAAAAMFEFEFEAARLPQLKLWPDERGPLVLAVSSMQATGRVVPPRPARRRIHPR